MIKVVMKTEPSDFNQLVRQPGNLFLKKNPNPNTKKFNSHNYWRTIKGEFLDSYEYTCAYCCQYIHLVTGSDNVEHFLPKTLYPNDAYEWVNYRLVCSLLNSRKGTQKILDPFKIQDGWFLIKFPSLLIIPNPSLKKDLQEEVQETIDILKLNLEGYDIVKSRCRYINCYCSGQFGFDHLMEEAPFLARELVRQDMVESIKTNGVQR